ncbi:MAG: RHS repeat-associated core domain-containing protein [Chlamydiota bacterium]
MAIKNFFLFFLFLSSLLTADFDPFCSDEDDISLFHHVNVMSGNLNLAFQDTVVKGPKPLSLLRSYSSSGAKYSYLFSYMLPERWIVQRGWSFFHEIYLLFDFDPEIRLTKACLAEKSGSMISYTFDHQEKEKAYFKPTVHGGPSSGKLSARLNPKNNRLELNINTKEAVLFLPTGGKKIFKCFNPIELNLCIFQLVLEILPSQHHITYKYEGQPPRLTHMELRNSSESKVYSGIFFDLIGSNKKEQGNSPFPFRAKTTDGKFFDYGCFSFKSEDSYLNEVKSNARSIESCDYKPGRKGVGFRIERLKLGGKDQFFVSYNCPINKRQEDKWARDAKQIEFPIDKVSVLEAPFGVNGARIPIARFFYSKGVTQVRDSENLLRRYAYDCDKIFSVEFFDEKDQLASRLECIWRDNCLFAKTLLDSFGKPQFAKTFVYDSNGNVLEEKFLGNLTGNSPSFSDVKSFLSGAESYKKKFSYLPVFNVPLVEEEENGLTYKYAYKEGTDLLVSKMTCDRNNILIREFFFYNEDNLLISEIIDDGNSLDSKNIDSITERQIKRYTLNPSSGLPSEMIELYWDRTEKKEKLIKKVLLKYSPSKEVIAEEVYDALGAYRFTINSDYDSFGHLIRKTNPLGEISTYQYDSVGNLIESQVIGGSRKKIIYDAGNRPIQTEEVDSLGNSKTSFTNFDTKGRILSQKDSKGNFTKQSYDIFGRCKETCFSATKDEWGHEYIPKVQYSYDLQGNITQTIAPRGESTQTFYNAYRKPIRIIQPDGGEVLHFYDKKGSVVKTVYPDKTEILYAYDLFQRMTSKKTYVDSRLLSSENWTYSAFHLLSHTDSSNLTNTYCYDGAGRKIQDETLQRKKNYFYDSLSFLQRTTEGEVSHIQIHDVAGRVVEDFYENGGSIENRMFFFYNKEGKKEKAVRCTSQGNATDAFTYDGEGRLISHTDPNGAITSIQYKDDFVNDLGQKVLQKTTIDPLGNRSIETYDALNHLVLHEKQSPRSETVSWEEFFYDRSGNKIQWISNVYIENKSHRKSSISWEVDSMGRITKEIEGSKTTLFSYDQRGRLCKKTFPCGKILTYSYDGIDRLLELTSSDATIHDRYFYNQGPYPIQINDLIHHAQLERQYNPFGQVIQEKGSLGLLHWEYDSYGRCRLFTLPDGSKIAYLYKGSHITSVQRQRDNGQVLYEHKYLEFDVNGHVSKEELVGNLGVITTTHDLLERPKAQSSSWMGQTISYGFSGLVMKKENTLLGDKDYVYDSLDQLLQEGNDPYSFDSLGNPAQAEVNDLNQILSTSDAAFEYDLNGNPTKKITLSGNVSYNYDALNRLTEINDGLKKVLFVYDPFSRLVSKEVFIKEENLFNSRGKVFYLYDQEMEIGSLNSEKGMIDLKILGLGVKGDIGASVAMEINSNLYVPLHDFNGNIIGLLSSSGVLLETYSMNAFGKEALSKSAISPWRFCSKRSEESLIFFGKRFYDPSLGRFLTPDPSGFSDGANLYIYALNSPLNRLDLFGLVSDSTFSDFSIEIPTHALMFSDQINHVVTCKGSIQGVQVDWVISCNYFHQLQYTPEELKEGKVNIVEHFGDLIPKSGGVFSLVSAENGINTTIADYSKNCQSIVSKISEGTLFIGIYNKTEGLQKDVKRYKKERDNEETPIVSRTRQVMVSIAQHIEKINPLTLWLHIAHSEGGLIALRSIEGMTDDQKVLIQKHMYLFAIAPALPVPMNYAFRVRNVYSEDDRVTKKYAEPYINNSNYDINVIPCSTSWHKHGVFTGDHSFLGKTYRGAYHQQIQDLREKYGFYDAKTR